MVICNIFVWLFFVKSLHEPGGSLIATITSTSTNYCCSVNQLYDLLFVTLFEMTFIFHFRQLLAIGYLRSEYRFFGGSEHL